jgi:hypothetical protein
VTNIHKVLRKGLYLRGQIEDRFSFTGHVPFSCLTQPRDALVFGELTSAKEFTVEKVFITTMSIRGNVL